jgi:hypothetical protein
MEALRLIRGSSYGAAVAAAAAAAAAAYRCTAGHGYAATGTLFFIQRQHVCLLGVAALAADDGGLFGRATKPLIQPLLYAAVVVVGGS